MSKKIDQFTELATQPSANDLFLLELDASGNYRKIKYSNIIGTGSVTVDKLSTELQKGWQSTYGSTTFPAPNTVTALGNRSYSCVFNSVDLSTSISAGMRLRTTRTVATANQCTSLNGTTQYYSKTTPNGMTFTDDFTVSAWVKLTSYGTTSTIASRYNGTSGWLMFIQTDGSSKLQGANAGSSNISNVASYQAIGLNRWVHVTAQLDMSAFTATTTTSYIMIDGVDVPALVARGGTNPTALVQAGNLEIGSNNAGNNFFPGKIAQVAIYSAKVLQATVLASMNQTLSGSETSLISAYSFNNTVNDLNANANNLTANGSAVATNADSPFGGQADGTINTTLDYGIVQKVSYSTNTTITVQVPEGCTIPTSGGVTAISYSGIKAPFGFPAQKGKWRISCEIIGTTPQVTITASSGTTAYPATAWSYLNTPIGEWRLGWQGYAESSSTGVTGNFAVFGGLYSITSSKLISPILRSQIGANTNYTDIAGTTWVDISLATPSSYTFAVGSNWTTSGTWYSGGTASVTGPVPNYALYADNALL